MVITVHKYSISQKTAVFCLLLVVCILPIRLGAQGNNLGSPSFLTVEPDARSMAMGGTGIATGPAPFIIYHNPAAGHFNESLSGAALSAGPWTGDFTLSNVIYSAAAFTKIGDKHILACGFRYFPGTESRGMDDMGFPTGIIRPEDFTIDAGYSLKILPYLGFFSNIRYISSSLDGIDKYCGMAFDMGGAYSRKLFFLGLEDVKLIGGARVSNVGPGMRIGGVKSLLPSRTIIEGSLYLPFSDNHRLFCSMMGYGQLSADRIFGLSVGFEYNLFRYFFLRTGGHIGDKNIGYGNYFTMGCGVYFGTIIIDFSYCLSADKSSPRNNTFFLTVGWAI